MDALKVKCAHKKTAVLGIAGIHLIFPTVTPNTIVERLELQPVIERRASLTAAELVSRDPMLTTEAAKGAGKLDAARGRGAVFEPWQYLPPLVYADETMRFFGIERVQLVESTLTRGLLVDESRWGCN